MLTDKQIQEICYTNLMRILCKIFGHKIHSDSCDIAGPSTCKRCGHKEPAIKWDVTPPMPKVKPPKIEVSDNLKRYICQLEQANAKLKNYIISESVPSACENLDSNQAQMHKDYVTNLLNDTDIKL